MGGGTPGTRSAGSSRRYPPIALAAGALLLLLAVLPSALNLPQSNPTETAEFAPVPPQDKDIQQPATGNFASLSLAGSSSLEGSPPHLDAPDPNLPNAPPPGGRSPSTKRCVGNPPRQSEDPLSPPCVANFSGDNFGDTYLGVTGEEVRVLVYVPRGGAYSNFGSRGQLARPQAKYFDLAEAPEQDDHYFTEAARIWQRYFNERFQTYGRFVHVYVYFSSGDTVEARRADATDNFKVVRPFGVLFVDVNAGNALPYIDVMADRGVMNFGAVEELPASAFDSHPRLLWGYNPSIEQHARVFSSYLCKKVVGSPVVVGDPAQHGQPRKLGLLSTTDPSKQAMAKFARLVRAQVEGCGGTFVADATFPSAGYIFGGSDDPRYAVENMAKFQQAGVTTIVWAEGFEQNQTAAASNMNYSPEWVVAGDGIIDDIVLGKYQDQLQWANAWVVSNATLVGPRTQEQCFLAAREVQPTLTPWDSSIVCSMYEQFRQLFIGIQVAGPRLGPTSVEKGFRAIPAVASTSPRVPACFYEPGDYTCVKDAIPMWWDSQARSPYSSSGGCYRVPENGRRSLATTWPDGNLDAQRAPDDPCNGFTGGTYLDPSPGPDVPPPQ